MSTTPTSPCFSTNHPPSISTSVSSFSDRPPLVLVTGGTGFLAKWVIATLLRANYRVRTTIRSFARIPELTSALLDAGIPPALLHPKSGSLDIVTADLSSNDGWAAALRHVDYVHHIASPFPIHAPRDDYDVIIPAVEGTKRVLKAARDARVKRVVLTSSVAAVAYGAAHQHRDSRSAPFTEENWTDLSRSGIVPAYHRAKTLAEWAAWVFVERDCVGSGMEMTVVNPVNIYGPVLGRRDENPTLRVLRELLDGGAGSGIPKVSVGVVDVRDCVDLLMRAMTDPRARGERFLCVGEGSLWMADIARILRRYFGEKARKVPTKVLPDVVVRGMAMFTPVAKMLLPELGAERVVSARKAREVLGWEWKYTSEDAVMAAAESILRFQTTYD
ncbi:uncharacterized protein BJX67DRAFT_386268 [Aspergillus lucknowensis]|uniref:NAD-dependent epimerase/dehydratase domain-containing protein n=1 Tax=Aspergillus lucknowensis TaxID=176173 RepID=A0ABR4L8M6_9EURO